jgi:rSAM/selenodomain-associated transferase 2
MSTAQKTSSISIIIPTLNEEEHLASTLAGLTSEPGIEAIVVDGGSTDRTIQMAEGYGIRVLSAPAGRARQMNTGAAQANGDILLFLHADTRLPVGFADHIRTALSKQGVVAGAFQLAIDGPGIGLRIIEKLANLRSRWLGLPYGDQAMFLPKSLFQELGGFPDQPIMEDFELARRLAKRGKIVILPLAVVTAARRWQRLGLLKTTLLNQAIVIAYLYGVSPDRLARWYRQRQNGRG